MWINVMLVFVLAACTIFNLAAALKYNNTVQLVLGIVCAALTGLNYYLI